MNLSIYNVLSQLITGFLLYLVGLHVLKLDPKYLDPIAATAVAYVIGYFVNSISAWLEWILNWTWGGRPSSQLLKGKKCARIKFVEHKKMNRLLHEKVEGEKMTTDDLFKVAMRIANDDGRIGDINGQYAFARSILLATVISSIVLGFKLYHSGWFWAITVVLVLSAWYRAKERGFYYVKEVLNVALSKLEDSKR